MVSEVTSASRSVYEYLLVKSSDGRAQTVVVQIDHGAFDLVLAITDSALVGLSNPNSFPEMYCKDKARFDDKYLEPNVCMDDHH